MEMAGNRQIDEVLDSLATFLMGRTDYPYFQHHRNRYLSDVQTIQGFYRGGDILEIGSVPCHMTAILKVLGYPVTGIDVDPDRCQWIIDQYGLNVRRCDIELQPLPFPNRTFRYVLFNEVFEHLRLDPLFGLSEINRVLTDDGTLMLTTPNLYAIQQIVRFLTGRGLGDPLSEFLKLRTIGNMGHIREYSSQEIRRFLIFNNFEITKLSFKHYYYPKTARGLFAHVLFRVLPSSFRSYQVVLARKAGPSLALAPLSYPVNPGIANP